MADINQCKYCEADGNASLRIEILATYRSKKVWGVKCGSCGEGFALNLDYFMPMEDFFAACYEAWNKENTHD